MARMLGLLEPVCARFCQGTSVVFSALLNGIALVSNCASTV